MSLTVPLPFSFSFEDNIEPTVSVSSPTRSDGDEMSLDVDNHNVRYAPIRRPYTYRNRQPKPPTVSKRKGSRLQIDTAAAALRYRCPNACLESISLQWVQSERVAYHSLTEAKKSEWLVNWQRANTIRSANGSTYQRFHLNGTDVCMSCWFRALDISHYKWTTCHLRKRSTSTESANLSAKKISIKSWLQYFIDTCCDKQPNSEEVHIPCFMDWKDLLHDYNTWARNTNHTTTLSYFSR
jgi:hypothetical protein